MTFEEQIPLFLTSCAFFILWKPFLTFVLPIPDKILADKNKISQTLSTHTYFACFNSLIHALLVLILGVYSVICYPNRWEAENVPLENKIMAFSFSYFTVDLVYGIIYKFNKLPMNLHHILAMLAAFITIQKNQCGFTMVFSWILGEISNPVFLIRCILIEHSKYEKVAYIFELTFFALFVFARGIIGSILAIQYKHYQLGRSLKLILCLSCFLTRVSFTFLVLYDY